MDFHRYWNSVREGENKSLTLENPAPDGAGIEDVTLRVKRCQRMFGIQLNTMLSLRKLSTISVRRTSIILPANKLCSPGLSTSKLKKILVDI